MNTGPAGRSIIEGGGGGAHIHIFLFMQTVKTIDFKILISISKEINWAEHEYIMNMRPPMDHSPIRQTFELGKFISTAGKSIINLVKL